MRVTPSVVRASQHMGKKLRASQLHASMDEENNPAAMICINQDPSKVQDINNYLAESIKIHDVGEPTGWMIFGIFYEMTKDESSEMMMKDTIIKSIKHLILTKLILRKVRLVIDQVQVRAYLL